MDPRTQREHRGRASTEATRPSEGPEMTTTTATAAPARSRPLGLSQYLGYACGDAANNLAFSMTSLFLLLYYTDVVGIAAAAVGTMFLVVRFFDAFADLFSGRMVDRAPVTRWGKFRPFKIGRAHV